MSTSPIGHNRPLTQDEVDILGLNGRDGRGRYWMWDGCQCGHVLAKHAVVGCVGIGADLGLEYDVPPDEMCACTEFVMDKPVNGHLVRGEASATGWPYGTTHDYDCPGPGCADTNFQSSPRSEHYWSS